MESNEDLSHGQDPARTPSSSATATFGHAAHPRSESPMEETKPGVYHAIPTERSHSGLTHSYAAQPAYHPQQSAMIPTSSHLIHHPPTISSSAFQGLSPTNNTSDNLIDNFPPPLPIPSINSATSHLLVSSGSLPGGTYSSVGSSDSLISQLAGVSAIHGQIARSNSRASDLGHGAGKKRTSPDKALQGLEQRAIQQGLGGLAANHPRLKVEDALGYLDQVKVIFAHKPKVYNDFLDIMKEFKSQSLDTPGVIQRVASLFHGHSDLIVGFNAFLPHGYKIDIDNHGIVKVTIPNNQVLTISDMLPHLLPTVSLQQDSFHVPLAPREKSQSPTSTVSADSDDDNKMDMDLAGLPMASSGNDEQRQLTQMDILCSTANFPKSQETESGRQALRSSAPSTKGVEFDYAINYVNKIKGRFNDQPHRYKRFLEILHAYQGKIRLSGEKPLDETDVFKEVGRLFGDHPDLMNDFSRFLPNACAMTGPNTPPATSSTRTTSPSRSGSSSPMLSSSQGGKTSNTKASLSSRSQSSSGKKADKGSNLQHSSRSDSGQKSGTGRPHKLLDKKAQKSVAAKSKLTEDLGDAGKSKNVPKKFGKQLTPKDVRNGRVPDILPEGPKKPVGRPSFTSDREKSDRSRLQDSTVAGSSATTSKQSKSAFRRRHEEDGSVDENSGTKNAKNKKNSHRSSAPVQRKKLKRLLPLKKVFKATRVVAPTVAFTYATFDDFSLMDRIRRAVPANVFNVLLKSFELYTSRVFTKAKLFDIVEKLLYHKPKLVQEFSGFLQTKVVTRPGGVETGGAFAFTRDSNDAEHRRVVAQKSKDPENRIAEIDFKAFEKFTDSRSYRIRPDNLPKQKSSGSTLMDREVLNDKYVSCPIFSEGSQFLISKKNIAEEVMFKCEDEKYEMDMLLAGAEAAIHAMTYKQEQIAAAGSSARSMTWEDAILHRRIIQKLYTENSGIIMAHLKKNPACSIPTVLERLKQKHIQWIRVQNSMSEIWMDQARRNASKIGDYKGATFKQTDMRYLRSRHMVHEMEKLYSERTDRQPKSATTVTQKQDDPDAGKGAAALENKPHLTLAYPKSPVTVDDVTFFILRYIKNHAGFGQSDKKKMNRFLIEYIFRCLKIPDTSNLHDFFDSSDDDTDSEDKLPHARRPSVPRLALSSSDEEDLSTKSGEASASKRSAKNGLSDDEAGSSDVNVSAKKARTGAKEFPIAPLPWPELCQYSADIQPLDAQVDESLSEEAKKREKKRERISRRLLSHEDLFLDQATSYVLVFGNSPFFLFVRYHQLLCERFATLRRSFQNVLSVSTGKQELPAYIVSKTCKPRIDVPVERFWAVFTDRLLKLLDGNIDPTSYEEEMREIFRKDAYLSFTLDRLIQSIARQLHHVVAQERAKTAWKYWEEAWLNGGGGGPLATRLERLDAEKSYESKVSDFLKDQNCFKIKVYDCGKVALELTDSEEPEDQQPLCRNWKDFVNYHANATKLDEVVQNALLKRAPLFIARQHRLLSRHRKQSTREVDEEDEEEDEDLALDVTKLSDQDGGTDFSLDDKSWLMTLNIRSQIESDDILGRGDDRIPLTSWMVYRRGAIQTANETHRRVSQRRTVAFKRYMNEVWTKKALITQEKHKAFLGMMRENMNRYKQGNSVEAPYFVYYVCKSDECERLENVKPYWQQEPENEPETEHEHEPFPEHDHDAMEREEKDEELVDTAPSESSDDEREDDTETETEMKNAKNRQKETQA